MDKSTKACDKAVADYVSLISLSVGCNPRSMKRLFNTYLLLDIILKGRFSKEEKDRVNLLLFAVICMQTEFENLYRYIVSSRDVIDADMLCSLADEITSNDEIISEIGIDDEAELSRISDFMSKFNLLLQEGDPDISEDSIDRLKELMSFSTVTSVNVAEGTDTKTDYDWKYRYINKEIAKSVNDELRSKYSYIFFDEDTTDFTKIRSALNKTAFMNVNKRGGGASTDEKIFWNYEQKYAPYIQRQIELLNPDVIVIIGKNISELIIPDEYKNRFIKVFHTAFRYKKGIYNPNGYIKEFIKEYENAKRGNE